MATSAASAAPEIETPNIDALAASGMRLTQFYSGSAVCTPTRISFLTGRYPLRYSCTTVWLQQGQYLPTSPYSLARLLKGAGYRTLHVGKWNQGGLSGEEIAARRGGRSDIPGPREQGFDHYYTVIEDNPGVHMELANAGRFYREGAAHMFRNDEPAEVSGTWLEDAVTDEALRLLDQQAGRSEPFFLNYWCYAPHTPLEPAPEPNVSKYENRATGIDLLYRSMVSDLDANVGRLVAKLKELDMYDNTLIFFTSDNGPLSPGSPGEWSGGKADLHEGGIRQPSFAVWPGHIAPGTTSDYPGHTNDLLPTFCAATQTPVPKEAKVDGIDLTPLLLGGTLAERSTLFWQMDLFDWATQPGGKPKPYATEIARRGRWKLLARGGKPVALHDLAADPKEQDNQLGRQTEVERQLTSELQAWLQEPRIPYGIFERR